MTQEESGQTRIAELSDHDALQFIGVLIDESTDSMSAEGNDKAFELLDELQNRSLAPEIGALTHYFRANIWANRRAWRDKSGIWDWEQPELQNEILELRLAVNASGFKLLEEIRRCQILTNLANQLNHVGRYVEAIEIWDRALRENDRYGMALGNRGLGLRAYADAHYDHGHAIVLANEAVRSLREAVSDRAVYDNPAYASARADFSDVVDRLTHGRTTDHEEISLDSPKYTLGDTTEEQDYRRWCLKNRLFINPLNDIGPHAIAARDILTLPSVVAPMEDGGFPPPMIGFFNQMKQEYVSARFFCYKGREKDTTHYSDRDVRLYNTLDYPAYSLSVEKGRIAFRMAYSILDKTAYFLNSYLSLGHDPQRVGFRNVWFEHKGATPRPLLKRFASYRNWPMRGLFWLSKDICEEGFKESTEPDAKALSSIRNHLEHKYLQIHKSWSNKAVHMSAQHNPTALRYSIFRDDFFGKTLRILKLARASLIYLSLGVHREEEIRRRTDKEQLLMPMTLTDLEDEWKN